MRIHFAVGKVNLAFFCHDGINLFQVPEQVQIRRHHPCNLNPVHKLAHFLLGAKLLELSDQMLFLLRREKVIHGDRIHQKPDFIQGKSPVPEPVIVGIVRAGFHGDFIAGISQTIQIPLYRQR